MKEGPHAVDIHVGKTIRIKRLMRKVSQTELGDRVGVTFQQIQKYEKGSNRVSANVSNERVGPRRMAPPAITAGTSRQAVNATVLAI